VRRLLNAVLFLLGLLALYAVSVQFRTSALRGLAPANFLSLFTTQSNVFAAFVLIFTPKSAGLRGAAALLAIWIIDPPVLRANYVATIAAWLAYPCVYACYTLVRGSRTHWYPYGFLDPRGIGLPGVAGAIATIAVFAALVACGLAWYAKRRRMAPQLT
jgi:hypothetical protein